MNRNIPLPLVQHGIVVNASLKWLCRASDFPGRLRLASWMERIFGERRIVAETCFGMSMALDKADLLQREILVTGAYEPELTQLLLQNIDPGDTFYDVGGNAGYYSLAALSRGAQVCAFEADPVSAALLTANLDRNAELDDHWMVVQCGVGATYGRDWFARAHVANSGVSGFGEVERVTALFPVEMLSLDQFVARGMAPPNLMKIDVEGWEANVIMGAEALFANTPPRMIVFEGRCDAQGRLNEPEIETVLTRQGYKIGHLTRQSGLAETRENYCAWRGNAPRGWTGTA